MFSLDGMRISRTAIFTQDKEEIQKRKKKKNRTIVSVSSILEIREISLISENGPSMQRCYTNLRKT